MTLTHLANFIRIAELQSLSKAAAVIRIAQPALSRQIRLLEAEFGTALLVRHAWGVSLTPAGETLLAHARRMLREAESARDSVQALSDEPRGKVSVGVPASLARALLPPLVQALRAKHPELRLHAVDGFSAVLHQRAVAGELDLAVLYEDRTIGPLATTPLLAEPLRLVGRRTDAAVQRAGSAEVPGTALILPARPNRLRLIVDAALAAAPEMTVAITEVDSVAAIVALVEQGAGQTILPYSAVADEVARGTLAVSDLPGPELSRSLLLVRPLHRQATAAVAAVEAELRALTHDRAAAMRWRPLTERTNT